MQQKLRGKDGQVKGIALQLPSGESGNNNLRRPLQYLDLLELDCKRDDSAKPGMNMAEIYVIDTDLAIQRVCALNANRPKRHKKLMISLELLSVMILAGCTCTHAKPCI